MKTRQLFLALSLVVASTVACAAAPKPTLNTPANGAINVPQENVKFSWSSKGATNSRIVISQNAAFSGFVDNNEKSACDKTCITKTTGSATSYIKTMDLAGQTYYWKVRANNSTGSSDWSDVRKFTTRQTMKITPLDAVYMSDIAQGFGLWNDYFGGFHTGLDIGAENNNPTVYAVEDGTVVWNSTASPKYTSNYSQYFNAFVVVNHGSFYAYYGHLKSTLKIGDKVSKGKFIGTIRDAYNSENALNRGNNHLHISISTGAAWVQQGWGYQKTQNGLKPFVDPKSYIGL